MVNSRKIFDDSRSRSPDRGGRVHQDRKHKGKLVLIGAEDDALWDTAKYIRRAEKRLSEKPHSCNAEFFVYKHGTHYVFPRKFAEKHFTDRRGLFLKLAFKAQKVSRRNASKRASI